MNRRSFIKNSALAGAAGLAVSSGFHRAGAAPAVLPNGNRRLPSGLRLPAEWPPSGMDPHSMEPMPVPYLRNRPAVVNIDTGRQLFIDDFLIERTDLERRYHQAKRHEANPVFYPETRHELEATGLEGDERAVCYLGHGGVFYDPFEKHYKMFYTAGWRGGLALAVSRDAVKWERPDLGLAGDNLILGPGNDHAGGDNCVWLDLQTDNPDERFKFMTTRGRAPGSRDFVHTLHTSPDGLHWSEGVHTGPASDYCSFYFDPFRRLWVYSIKQNGPRGRCRYYSENADFLKGANWDDSVYWTNADKLDPPDPEVGDQPQLYSLNAVAYESVLIGMHYIHRGPNNRICLEGQFPKNTDLALGFSRDGFHWDRPDRTSFLAGTRREEDWDRAYLHSTTGVMLVDGDRLLFPYTGYSGQSPDGTRGMYTGASIGLGILRRDGFASMESSVAPGELTTRPVRFRGRHLFVNVNCPHGSLTAEVLDDSGNPIPGLSGDSCVPVKTDSTLHRIEWKDGRDLSRLAGHPIRFRFHLDNGALYSFWVSRGESGASHGYLGAGGPGHDGVLDTKGQAAKT